MNSVERLMLEEEGRSLGILRGPTPLGQGGKIQRDSLSLDGQVVTEEARVADAFQIRLTDGQLAQVIIHEPWSVPGAPVDVTGNYPANLQVTKLPIPET